MDEKSSLINSNMPETDQNVGEELTQHSRALGMILGKEIKKKKKKTKKKEKLYAVRHRE